MEQEEGYMEEWLARERGMPEEDGDIQGNDYSAFDIKEELEKFINADLDKENFTKSEQFQGFLAKMDQKIQNLKAMQFGRATTPKQNILKNFTPENKKIFFLNIIKRFQEFSKNKNNKGNSPAYNDYSSGEEEVQTTTGPKLSVSHIAKFEIAKTKQRSSNYGMNPSIYELLCNLHTIIKCSKIEEDSLVFDEHWLARCKASVLSDEICKKYIHKMIKWIKSSNRMQTFRPRIFCPCSGYGGLLYAALSFKPKCITLVDTNTALGPIYREIIQDYQRNVENLEIDYCHHQNIEASEMDHESSAIRIDFYPQAIQSYNTNEKFDLSISCPPYFTIEEYPGDSFKIASTKDLKSSYEKWCCEFLVSMIKQQKQLLTNTGIGCLILNSNVNYINGRKKISLPLTFDALKMLAEEKLVYFRIKSVGKSEFAIFFSKNEKYKKLRDEGKYSKIEEFLQSEVTDDMLNNFEKLLRPDEENLPMKNLRENRQKLEFTELEKSLGKLAEDKSINSEYVMKLEFIRSVFYRKRLPNFAELEEFSRSLQGYNEGKESSEKITLDFIGRVFHQKGLPRFTKLKEFFISLQRYNEGKESSEKITLDFIGSVFYQKGLPDFAELEEFFISLQWYNEGKESSEKITLDFIGRVFYQKGLPRFTKLKEFFISLQGYNEGKESSEKITLDFIVCVFNQKGLPDFAELEEFFRSLQWYNEGKESSEKITLDFIGRVFYQKGLPNFAELEEFFISLQGYNEGKESSEKITLDFIVCVFNQKGLPDFAELEEFFRSLQEYNEGKESSEKITLDFIGSVFYRKGLPNFTKLKEFFISLQGYNEGKESSEKITLGFIGSVFYRKGLPNFTKLKEFSRNLQEYNKDKESSEKITLDFIRSMFNQRGLPEFNKVIQAFKENSESHKKRKLPYTNLTEQEIERNVPRKRVKRNE